MNGGWFTSYATRGGSRVIIDEKVAVELTWNDIERMCRFLPDECNVLQYNVFVELQLRVTYNMYTIAE